MCGTCGCSAEGEIAIHTGSGDRLHLHREGDGHHPPHHHHSDSHGHHHHHHGDGNYHRHHPPAGESATRELAVGRAVLAKNERLAERNRGYFLAKNLFVLNVMSSPGAGKTTWLERMLADLSDRLAAGVVVGDLATDNDAQRLRRSGAPVAQITTGTLCHLEADLVLAAAQQLPLDNLEVLFIENVGNLVCPAAYDLGENLRVVLLSTTEGEDKPLKYPTAFKAANLVIVTKIDIAEAVGCDRSQIRHNIHQIAPQAEVFEVSARSGEGLEAWYQFLLARSGQLAAARAQA